MANSSGQNNVDDDSTIYERLEGMFTADGHNKMNAGLVRYFDQLVHPTLNLDRDVTDDLISQCVLLAEDREEIEKEPTASMRNAVLVQILIDRPFDTVRPMSIALTNSEDANIYSRKIVADLEEYALDAYSVLHKYIGNENVSNHKIKLQKNYKFIVQNTINTSVCDKLMSSNVITWEDREEILSTNLTTSESNRRLLGKLLRKDINAYNALMEAYKADSQYRIVGKQIEETEVTNYNRRMIQTGLKARWKRIQALQIGRTLAEGTTARPPIPPRSRDNNKHHNDSLTCDLDEIDPRRVSDITDGRHSSSPENGTSIKPPIPQPRGVKKSQANESTTSSLQLTNTSMTMQLKDDSDYRTGSASVTSTKPPVLQRRGVKNIQANDSATSSLSLNNTSITMQLKDESDYRTGFASETPLAPAPLPPLEIMTNADKPLAVRNRLYEHHSKNNENCFGQPLPSTKSSSPGTIDEINIAIPETPLAPAPPPPLECMTNAGKPLTVHNWPYAHHSKSTENCFRQPLWSTKASSPRAIDEINSATSSDTSSEYDDMNICEEYIDCSPLDSDVDETKNEYTLGYTLPSVNIEMLPFFHSALTTQGAESLIKDAQAGSYLFRFSSSHEAKYSFTFVTDRGNIIHGRLAFRDGKYVILTEFSDLLSFSSINELMDYFKRGISFNDKGFFSAKYPIHPKTFSAVYNN